MIWLLSLIDLLFTIWANRFTHFREANPLAKLLLRHGMYGALSVFKIVLTALGTALIYINRKYHKTEFVLWGMLIFYLLLMVKWLQYTQSAKPLIF